MAGSAISADVDGRGATGLGASNDVTGLLLAWSEGDALALEKLIPIVYDELRRLARRYLRRERAGHSLQSTELVHEAYARLIEANRVQWQDRAHFLAVCAQLMRRILVDHARSRRAAKRGGGIELVPLDAASPALLDHRKDVLAIDEALNNLALVDRRKAQVVELRFFGGLTSEEAADVLKTSPDTVKRDWKVAKVWLLRELSGKAVR